MAKKNKLGFAGLNSDLNSGNSNSNVLPLIEELQLRTVSARVTDIILSDTHPLFKQYGEWNGLGTIFCEPINNSESRDTSKLIAKPLISNIKNFPLVNEIVLLFQSPTPNTIEEVTDFKPYFYLNPLSLWNHPHHNAYPNPINNSGSYEDTNIDYLAAEEGKAKRINSTPQEINLSGDNPSGGEFVEKGDIHPILPFIGDNIFEGRFGNSIRLGSTVRSKSIYQNKWSQNGDIGDPISIFKNGQPSDSSDEGWVPIVEDINKDLSSLYLTSTQTLPIEVSSKNYTSISQEYIPTYPASYNQPQIILNSGRLLFNSTTDSILLSSKKVIALSAIEDIGISTNKNITLTGDQIKLGGINAGESLILGDSFIKQFNVLLDTISLLCDSLVAEPALTASAPAAASQLKTIINLIKDKNYLSSFSKTI